MNTLPLIELTQCSVIFDERPALDDVSFSLRKGERWALIGANGSGKTLLLKLLRGDVWPTPTGREKRVYALDGTVSREPGGSKEQIAYVGPERQDKYVRYGWDLTVLQVVTTGLFDEDIPLTKPSRAQQERVARALRKFGVWALRNRRFLRLSYGQRRLALIARAFVGDAPVLLLDEVFNGLDAKMRAKLRKALEAPQSRHAWLLTTHRPKELPRNLTHIARMEGGRIVYSGPVATNAAPRRSRGREEGDFSPHLAPYLTFPRKRGKELKVRGKESEFQWKRSELKKKGSEFRGKESEFRGKESEFEGRASESERDDSEFERKASGFERNDSELESKESELEGKESELQWKEAEFERKGKGAARLATSRKRAQQPQAISFPPSLAGVGRKGANWFVRLRDVDLFRDYRHVVRKLDWTINRGEHWAILGANGSGKSTLLSLLYGDMHPALGGTIERRGAPVGTRIEMWKRRVGWVSPELQADHYLAKSIEEIVISGRYSSVGLNEPPTAADRKAAKKWLNFFGIAALRDRGPRAVSYGQMRLALFARAMINGPELLLLDEPCTGLDGDVRAHVLSVLEQLAQRDVQIVMAVHDPEDIILSVKRVLSIGRGGRVVLGERERRGKLLQP